MARHKLLMILFCFIFITPTLFSKELILINRPISDNDKRSDYPKALITMAMQKTQQFNGDFKIEYAQKMKWKRAKHSLEKGKFIHVIQAATRPNWEKDLLAVRIPIMKGLLGNRVFLIKKENQDSFAKLQSIDELKKLSAGLGNDWSITSIFKKNNFNVVTGSSYEGLFSMLDFGHFDYFPRGVNEILVEYNQRKDKFPSIHIEEKVLLYLPLPVYFFVTPTKPELAKRIEKGLNIMIEDGSFDKIFFEFHEDILSKINIKERKVFRMPNENLGEETPFDRKELWLNIQDE